MRLVTGLLLIGMAFFGATAPGNAASLLTFDDLPAGGPSDVTLPAVPNGYGGLNWNNFAVVNGLEFPITYGYYMGVVSPDNVIFNIYGDPASISVASGLFDFDSAYLTAALNLNTPLQIEVQGFRGSALLYDNTYTENNTTHALANFDYIGVDLVRFIPSPAQQFVMDNVTVVVPEPSAVVLGLLFWPLVFAVRNARKIKPPRTRPNHHGESNKISPLGAEFALAVPLIIDLPPSSTPSGPTL